MASPRPGGGGAAPAAAAAPGPAGAWPRVSAALWRRPWARATLLLTPALAWFVLIYLAALVVLLITAFWQIDPFTSQIVRVWNLGNFTLIFENSAYGKASVGPVNLIYTNWAVFIVFCYIWLPFMIIPVYAALERIPPSQIEASQDLGARTWRTLRLVILPLVLRGLAAGSIFTFSLTLGDFITPILIGGTGSNFMGNVIEQSVGIAGNVPFAAAMALIPVAIMAVYLVGARALGAFRAL